MNDQPPLLPPVPPPIPPAAKPYRQPSLIVTLLIAGVIFLYDTQVQAMPVCSMIMLTVGNVFLLGGLLIAWGKGAPVWPRVLRIAIFTAVAFAARGSIRWEWERAHQKAQVLIVAVKTFRTAEGRYPDGLEELVPRYLPAIPSVQLGIGRPGFYYYVTGDAATFKGADASGHHWLEYVSVPPFGKSFYDFEAGAWGFRD